MQNPKQSGAQYAQKRRDREVEERDKLEALLPTDLFSKDEENDKQLNLTTKVLVAAREYIEMEQAVKDSKEEVTEQTALNQPFVIPTTLSGGPPHEEIRQLRQVAQRLVHKAEERLMVEGSMTEELSKTLEKISDLIIDQIEEIEKQL